jgi:ethanolamine phosphate transferase 2 subunit G
MSIPWSKLAILVANLLLPVALVVFSSGFFPYKPLLPGMEAFEQSNRPPPIFEKVIFMVVDALRR